MKPVQGPPAPPVATRFRSVARGNDGPVAPGNGRCCRRAPAPVAPGTGAPVAPGNDRCCHRDLHAVARGNGIPVARGNGRPIPGDESPLPRATPHPTEGTLATITLLNQKGGVGKTSTCH